MVLAGLASWTAAALAFDADTSTDVLFGMIGPLVAVSGSWILAERTYTARPEALTTAMIAAFAFKLVFFGAYVAVMIGLVHVRPGPFIASFTSYFVVLYGMEALFLRRLFLR